MSEQEKPRYLCAVKALRELDRESYVRAYLITDDAVTVDMPKRVTWHTGPRKDVAVKKEAS